MNEKRQAAENEDGLIRGLGLKEATSANIVEMLGIGPFITIPFLLAAMGGPHAMLGWAAGAVLAVCDGLVWAELGAAMPGAGGSYIYLREAYNPKKLGQMMSFLFVWMIFFTAPLSVATGAVGFAEYSRYFFPGLSEMGTKAVAVALCVGVTLALYRGIRTIGKVSFVLMIVVVGSILWVIVSGWPVMRTELLFDIPAEAFSFSWGFFQGLGGAALIAIYGYGGYNNVCFLGGEVKQPSRNIPLAVIGSIVIVATLYVLLNISLIGVVPWREAIETKHIVSDYMQIIYGDWAAQVITVLILGASFASIFALLLGYSRIPYAAAKDGRFFSVFAKLHPVKRFPHVSLLVLGGFSVFWCFLELSEIIESLMSIQTLILFLSQILAVTLVRRNRPDIKRPFKMWLYPVPSIVAAVLWLLVMISTGVETVFLAIGVLAAGIGIYMVWAKISGAWPFQQE